MDPGGNKLDLSGKPATNSEGEQPSAKYKVIPETDMEGNEEAVTRPKNLVVKLKSTGPESDGADEKMLSKEAPMDMSEVNLAGTPGSDKQNGDAKLDIGDVKSAFVGLTKEELMRYANDPFWVRLRWFLFITFWLLWALMLLGAVLIIYAAPKCDPPPPRTWWQKGPLAESPPDFETIKALKDKGVKGVIVEWAGDAYSATIDGGGDEKQLKALEDFRGLLKRTKEEAGGVNVIVELEPAVSSLWFDRAERGGEWREFYLWRDGRVGGDGGMEFPNNWHSIKNESSWKYSNISRSYYYSPTGTQPHLNFRNPNVTLEFAKVLHKFLDLGASGIRLKSVPFLLVDSKFDDEARLPSLPSTYTYGHQDYGFYSHSKTENLLDLAPLLSQWRSIVKNRTDNGPFMMSDDLGGNIEAYRVNGSFVVDLPQQSRLFGRSNLTSDAITRGLNSSFSADAIEWPLWKYNHSDVLDLVAFLLPGVPLIDKDAPINSELLKVRESPSIMQGNFSYHEVANKTVFAFIRVASGNPGILVAFNPTDSRIVVDFPAEIQAVSNEVTVQLMSSNYNETGVSLNVKQEAKAIPISPKSAIVLSYVPKAA